MNISNLKIGTRLGAGFGVVLLLLLLVAGVAIGRIQSINSAVSTILDDRYVKVTLARAIQDEVNVQARFIRNAIIGGHDPAEVSTSLGRLEESVQKNVKMLGDLKATINSDKGKQLFDSMMVNRDAYAAARNQAVKLLRDGQVEAAGAFVLKELRPPQNAFFAALKSIVDYQQELMSRSGETARADGKVAITSTLVLSSVAALAAIGLAWLITRSITVPVNQAVQVAQTVAAGDLTSHISSTSRDEIGMLLASLSDMNDKLKNIVGEVRSGTDEIATSTTEVATGNMDLSSRTEEQASALEQTASSMEELTSTVRQNGDNARQANQLAQSAAEVAQRGGEVVSQVVVTMESISTSANKIVDIISVIDGIAFQTNILALNAAVEAARAGEQGRGFAVVATEVRNLAQRSAGAAKEIKTLIGDSVEKVEAGNRLVSTAGSTMHEVVSSVQRLTSLVGEITAASREQEVGIEQINQAITSMDTVTQQNAAVVEEAAAATSALQEQASRLAQTVSVFRLDQVAVARPKAVLARKQVALVARAPVARQAAPSAKRVVNGEQDWEEF